MPKNMQDYMGKRKVRFFLLFPSVYSPCPAPTNSCAILEIEKGVEGIQIEEKKPEEKKNDRSLVKDKSAQLEAKLEKENKKKMESHVIIKRVERTKRKCVTTIHGLEVFGKSRRLLKWGGCTIFDHCICARRRLEESSKDVC